MEPAFQALKRWHMEGCWLICLALGIMRGECPQLVPWMLLLTFAVCNLLPLPWSHFRLVYLREGPYLFSFFREAALALVLVGFVENPFIYLAVVLAIDPENDHKIQDNTFEWLESFSQLGAWVPPITVDEGLCFVLVLEVFLVASPIRSKRDLDAPSALAESARFVRCVWVTRMLRTVAFMSTRIPPQIQRCERRKGFDFSYSWVEHAREAFQFKTGGGCNDQVFSGHVLMLTTSACGVQYGLRKVSKGSWLAGLVWLRTLSRYIHIIMSRHHLSVDVILAWAVGYLFWGISPRAETFRGELPFAVSYDGSELDHDIGARAAQVGPGQWTLALARSWTTAHRRMPWGCRWVALAIGLAALMLCIGFVVEPRQISSATRARIAAIDVAHTEARPSRLLCVVVKRSLVWDVSEEFALSASQTWGQSCDDFISWPSARIEPTFVRSPGSREKVFRLLWREVRERFPAGFDWAVVVEDRTFVAVQNLRFFTDAVDRELAEELARGADAAQVGRAFALTVHGALVDGGSVSLHVLNAEGVNIVSDPQWLIDCTPLGVGHSLKTPETEKPSCTGLCSGGRRCQRGFADLPGIETMRFMGCRGLRSMLVRLDDASQTSCDFPIAIWPAGVPRWFHEFPRSLYTSP